MRSSNSAWIFLFVFGLATVAATTNYAKIKYTVKPVEETWFVINDANGKPEAINAKRSDDIEWTADGSDMVFQFPLELSKLFTKENGDPVGNGYVIKVDAGDKLKLKVKNDAPVGEFVYSVYVTASGTYAEGSSPPVMIISR